METFIIKLLTYYKTADSTEPYLSRKKIYLCYVD